jgi:hypothetical protein
MSKSESKLYYDRHQLASLSWCQAPIWDPSVEVEVEVTLQPTVNRPLRLGVSPLLGQVTRCYIYFSDNYFLYFSCMAPSLMKGRVCNLQCNDASSILSYTATDGLLV